MVSNAEPEPFFCYNFSVYSKYIRASLCISDVPESSSQTYNNPVNLNTANNRRTDNKYEGVDD